MGLWLFWMMAGGLGLAAAGALAVALLRPGPDQRVAADYDIAVYRDQLKEIARDRARGLLGEEEAERARVEVSRRLLDADRARAAANPSGAAPPALNGAMAVIVAVVVLGGGLALYWGIGRPGAGDLPLGARLAAIDAQRAAREPQAAVEATLPGDPDPGRIPAGAGADYLDLVGQLRAVVAERPDDPQGLALLAEHEAALGRFRAARAAQAAAIAGRGADATAQDHATLAWLMIAAAGGYVSPEAEAALDAALERDPRHPFARYAQGLMYAQGGRHDLAFAIWRPLLEESPPDAPWAQDIRVFIEGVAARAGVDYELPPMPAPPAAPPGPGPTAEQMQAAEAMSADDRQAMIQGMVEGLATRLATEGGPPEDWARLIAALGVLGQTERARAILSEARTVFPDAAMRAPIEAAAAQAGLIE
jgi:cytochrome c-type biogenesis protein CcmH